MSNPILEPTELPQFSKIKPEHIIPATEQLLDEARQLVEEKLAAAQRYTWENLIQPIEDIDDRINKAWSPISHMNSVVNTNELRDAYNSCLPKLSQYATEMGQHKKLFEAYQAIAEGDQFKQLDTAQQKIINNALRDFRLSGIDLPANQQARYKAISQELTQLGSQFGDNVLDATQAWSKQLDRFESLQGLPETALQLAKQTAELQKKSGWLFTLEFPSYMAVMTFADDRNLRQEMHEAFTTRASDQGPHAGQWNNSEIMGKLLALRHEKAQLLGFNNFAELSLATKMADKPEEVITFLNDLANKSISYAKRDLEELRQFAKQESGIANMEAWDIPYLSEKMRQHQYDLSQEEVKQYFPVSKVLPGLFSVVEKLYGLKTTEVDTFDRWHDDVRFFEIHDDQQQLRGKFFLDLYARPKKRGGAWMDDCVTRKKSSGSVQTPVAYLTCNFTPPTSNDPALLTHDEVTTLFHEFGHGLHHMLTKVDHLGVAGINGVEWDAVELPSQFMENWCWEQEALGLISGHYKTGEPLPEKLFKKMLAAKNFQSGMQMVRQLEFSLFDFRIHLEYQSNNEQFIQEILDDVRNKVAVMQPPTYTRFQNSFSHIFAGGYAAGYYSYKWAEVLSSDAFSLFEEKGIFDRQTGLSFLSNVLEKGGSEDAKALFVAFRGREPKVEALLRHAGMVA
ncbi:MAG: oligopeptidase A [Methylococcaceae bacterium]